MEDDLKKPNQQLSNTSQKTKQKQLPRKKYQALSLRPFHQLHPSAIPIHNSFLTFKTNAEKDKLDFKS